METFHTKRTSKKSRPPSGNLRTNSPKLPRSPSRSFSSREAGWKIVSTIERIAENSFRIAIRTAYHQCFKRPWNRTTRIARFPKGPKIEKIQSRLKFSISLEIFNPDLQNSNKNRGLVGGSLEMFNLVCKFQDLDFLIFRPLGF